jgi:hypothetical protein
VPSAAGVIWAVAVWDGVKSPISEVAKLVKERNVRKNIFFVSANFIIFVIKLY